MIIPNKLISKEKNKMSYGRDGTQNITINVTDNQGFILQLTPGRELSAPKLAALDLESFPRWWQLLATEREAHTPRDVQRRGFKTNGGEHTRTMRTTMCESEVRTPQGV